MTTYKIKKEFTPMDFYDYVKSQGREKCKEFKKDFLYWLQEAAIFCSYTSTTVGKSRLETMLSERANFRRYMIEGGFVEEEKPPKNIIFELIDCGDFYELESINTKSRWSIAQFFKDGRGMYVYSCINDPMIQTDSAGKIKIL